MEENLAHATMIILLLPFAIGLHSIFNNSLFYAQRKSLYHSKDFLLGLCQSQMVSLLPDPMSCCSLVYYFLMVIS